MLSECSLLFMDLVVRETAGQVDLPKLLNLFHRSRKYLVEDM